MMINDMNGAREVMYDLLAGYMRNAPSEMMMEVIEDLDRTSAQWVIMAAQEMTGGMFMALIDMWGRDSDMTEEQIIQHSLESLKERILG